MSSNWPNPGLRSSAEYQCSGIPYVTSSNDDECGTSTPVQIKFPFVTRWVEINTWKSSAATSHLRVGFTANGGESQRSHNRFNSIRADQNQRTAKVGKSCSMGSG